jgi:hypothetical protein
MRLIGKWRFFLVLLACLGVWSVAPACADSAPTKPLLFPPANTPEARLVRVQLGPHIFDIPRNARDIEMDRAGKLDAMSMHVMFPTMEGMHPDIGRKLVFLGQEARDLQVLLSDRLSRYSSSSKDKDPHRWPLRKLWRALTDVDYQRNPDDSLNQLMNELDRLHIDRLDRFGLIEFKLTDKTPDRSAARFSMRDGRNVFADLAHESVLSIIECSSEQKVSNPSCALDFTYRTLDVRIHFVQALLPDWRAIRDGFSRYLDERCVNC